MSTQYRELSDDPKDALRIIRIQEAVGWGRYRPGPEVLLKSLRRRQEQEGLRIFLLELDGKVIGYCELIERPRPGLEVPAGAAYVSAIAVDPRRAGQRLVGDFGRWVLGQAHAAGFEALIADVAIDNAASMNLNAALGAQFCGPSPSPVAELMSGAPPVRVHLRTGHADSAETLNAGPPGAPPARVRRGALAPLRRAC